MKPVFLNASYGCCLVSLALSMLSWRIRIEKKGTAPYVTHFIFRPLQTLDVSGVGTATLWKRSGRPRT